jgi:hypothetical protein
MKSGRIFGLVTVVVVLGAVSRLSTHESAIVPWTHFASWDKPGHGERSEAEGG